MTTPLVAPDPAHVLTKAVRGAADRLGLRNRELADILGSSEASVSRLSRGRMLDPAGKEGELALLLLRLFRSLDALMGGNEEQSRAWFDAANGHLGGRPRDLVSRVEGLVDVVQYLDAVRGRL